MKLKNIVKRGLIITLAAGITVTSIPLPSYAATISRQDTAQSSTVEETEISSVEGDTETAAETTVEEGSTGPETETDTKESSTEPEAETETGTKESSAEPEAEPETGTKESSTEPEAETETIPETETTDETQEEKQLLEQIEEMEKQAKEALQELTSSEYVMALLYLCDSYDVRAKADKEASTVAAIWSGTTVFIQDVTVNTETMTVWYQVSFAVDGQEYTGYIERNFLAYSNENFLSWEEKYVDPILLIGKNNAGVLRIPENDGATAAYSSDIDQFPDSYKSALQSLKDAHPNWTFVKFNTNLNWDTVVYNESNPPSCPNRSLVYKTAKDAWKNGQYDSNWYYASEAAVKYCLDPRNGLTESRIFQFEQLTFNKDYHTVSAIQGILNATFMKSYVPQTHETFAEAFYNIGSSRKISPFHLAARVLQEQGTQGGSPLISGTYPGYEGYYNYFNIGATSDNPIVNGLKYAKEAGWNTPYKSLEGGAKSIGNNYILQGQDSLYLQKWDVESSYHGLYSHQYMQNIQAAMSEASTMRNLYNQAGALNGKFVFKIPVYNDMPSTACPDPNDVLKLSTNSIKLKGGYDTTITYTINDSKSTVSFKIGDSSIVKVEAVSGQKAFKITALKPGTTKVVFSSSGGGSATCEVTVLKDTITLSEKEIEVTAGTSDGTLAGTPIEITYTIDNPKSEVKSCTVEKGKEEYLTVEKLSETVDTAKNTITGKLKLTGLKPGEVKLTITSKYGGSLTKTVKIVRLPEKLEINTPTVTVSRDNCKTAHATVYPEDTTNKNLLWSSADEKIAAVNPSSGRITGVSAGTVKLTATTEANTLATGKPLTVECTVTVVPSVEEIRLASGQEELLAGETFALNGEIYPADAKESGLYTILYASSDEEVATVDAQGTVTAKAAGNTVITATVKDPYASSGTKTAVCRVNVVTERREAGKLPEYSYVQPEEIQVYKRTVTETVSGNTVIGSTVTEEEVSENTYAATPLKSGESMTLSYKLVPEEACVEKVTWESSKPSVVKVAALEDGTAAVTAVTKGKAVITIATDIGVKRQLNVTVEEKQPLEKITLDRTKATIYVNGTEGTAAPVSMQLTPAPQAGEESGIAYLWSSSDEAAAVVDENGRVTAKAAGSAVITAADAGGSGKYAVCTVTVERCIEKLSTSVDALCVQAGKTVSVTAAPLPADYTYCDLTWESSNTAAVSVNEKGAVSVSKDAEAGTQAVITVTDKVTGLKQEIPLTVTENPAKSVALYKEGSLEAGKPVNIKTAELYANGGAAEQTVTFRAAGYTADGKRAENLSFYAVSSNSKVAVVEQNVDEAGKYDGTFTVTAKGKGTTSIKIYAADGSKKTASLKVTAKLYPEQVILSKEALYITPGGSGTLAAKLTPSDAADKTVYWKFKDDKAAAGFTLNEKTGKVTVAKGTPAGETAEFTAVAKAGGAKSEVTCKVTVVSSKVFGLKLEEKNLLMLGEEIAAIPAKKLTVTVSPEKADVKLVKFTSSNEAVAAVDETGKVTAVGYGTATITAATLDNSKKAACKVTVSALDKGYKLSAVSKTVNLQNYALDINGSAVLGIKDQFGNVPDNTLFTFTSSNPAVVKVSKDGVVTPNPSLEAGKGGKAKVTAALTGDPYKRKVTFQVNVLAKEQAESVSVTALNVRGSDIANESFAVRYPTDVLTFHGEAANVYGEKIDVGLKWTVSDSSMAAVKVDGNTGNAVVTVKKPGKFYLTAAAGDTLKKSRRIQISVVDAKPVLEEKKITLNKKAQLDEQGFVQSSLLHLVENKDCPVSAVTVKAMTKGTTGINVSKFEVREVSEGCFTVCIPEASLKSIDKGNYKTVLSVETKGIPELGMQETITHEFTVTVSISDTAPKVSVKKATINRQLLTDLNTVLDISTSVGIESVKLVEGQNNKFDTYFALKEENGSFVLSLANTEGYHSLSMTGLAEIKLEGYQPVRAELQVETPVAGIALVQSEVPNMDVKCGSVQKLRLLDKNTGKALENFEIKVPENAGLDIQNLGNGVLGIKPVKTMVEKGEYKNAGTVSTDIAVTAKAADGTVLWAAPTTVKVTVKTYTAVPKVTLSTKTLQLNRQAPDETVEAAITTDRGNVRIADDSEWRIEQYNAKDKSYSVIKDWEVLPENTLGDVVLSYNRQKGTICAAAKAGAVLSAGNYKYRITWIAEDYSFVECEVTVIVADRAVSAKISAKGKLDLLTRADSTMQGTVKLTNTNSKIKSVTILEKDENGEYKRNEKYYSLMADEKVFQIRLKQSAAETTGKKTVPVKIVLEGGTAVYSQVSFNVTQSTPKVTIPKAGTIYKAGSNTTVVYDMNAQIKEGYAISAMKAYSVPEGLGVTVENGRISVSLTDRYLKPGTYSMKINMYFKGAQEAMGSAYGKAFSKTIKVIVK